MANPLVLQLDLTGSLPANLIENEAHVLDETTGRIFALNYGGFYSASVIITRQSDNAVLVPGVDFVALAPNDAITKQTGLESMSVLALTKETNFDDTYVVTYRAVGGDYSTNVDVVRDVIQAISQNTGTVEWGLILNKPPQFDAAPHLIDFRSGLYGFEGLIASIQNVVEKMTDPSPSQLQAVLNTVNSGLTAYKTSVDQQLSMMQTQINNLLQSIPNVSGFFSGSAASTQDVKEGFRTNRALVAANMAAIASDLATTESLGPGETLDNTTKPLVRVVANFASSMPSTGNVPNANCVWLVKTIFTSPGNPIQIAECLTWAPGFINGEQLILRRVRGVSPWDRVDSSGIITGRLKPATTAQLDYGSAQDNALMTPLTTRQFFEINQNITVPIGGVIAYATDEALDSDMLNWWQLCQGQLLDVSSYQLLFNKIQYTFGGSGGTFRLPDLRGVVIRGHDNRVTGGRDPDRAGAGFGSYQEDAFQGHSHAIRKGTGSISSGPYGAGFSSYESSGSIVLPPIPDGINGTPRTAQETRMKNVSLNYLIRTR